MAWRWVRRRIFVVVHAAYFLVISLLGALSIWAAPKPAVVTDDDADAHFTFLHALFNAVSAVTETGLASVPMHRFALSAQISLVLLMFLGGQVFTSAIPLFLRRLFLRHTDQISNQRCIQCASPSMQPLHKDSLCPALPCSEHPERTRAVLPLTTEDDLRRKAVEHEALVIMSWLTVSYLIFAISLGFLVCLFCVIASPHATAVLKQNQVNASLFSIFATVSAFGNCGFTPLDDNMVPLQRSWVMLLCMSALMLMGSTLYAPSLRLCLWLLYKRAKGSQKRVFALILDRKEKQFTHIFPRTATTWLVCSAVFLNACQMMCMLGIDWSSEAWKAVGAGYKLVGALFQALSARFGGFNVVNLSDFSSATLFVTLVAMYIAAYPVWTSANRSAKKHEGNLFFEQLSKLRRKDSFLLAAVFIICLLERHSMRDDPLNFSLFNIVFEVISAYGNVGLTMGYSCSLKAPMANTDCRDRPSAFCSRWSSTGRVVLMLVMLSGRNQNILDDIDWDIRFPMEKPL